VKQQQKKKLSLGTRIKIRLGLQKKLISKHGLFDVEELERLDLERRRSAAMKQESLTISASASISASTSTSISVPTSPGSASAQSQEGSQSQVSFSLPPSFIVLFLVCLFLLFPEQPRRSTSEDSTAVRGGGHAAKRRSSI